MPSYAFAARDQNGLFQSGTLEASNFGSVVESLRQRGWTVLDVQAEQPSALDLDLGKLLAVWAVLPVRQADIELSLRQLALMLRSGLTLLDSLRMLGDHAGSASMRKVWTRVSTEILTGESLAGALAKHRCFAAVVVELAGVGEQTGELDGVLVRAAAIIENRRRLRSQILTALAYPMIVLVAALAVTGFMVFHVIPELQVFLEAMDAELPAMTQVLIDVTHFVNKYAWHGAVTLVALLVAFFTVRTWPPGRLWTDHLALRIPILGGVLRTAATAAFSRNMQTLLQSGVSLLTALKSVEGLLTNRHLTEQLAAAREAVINGRTLAESLPQRAGFTGLLTRMIAVGESSGRLDEVLGEAADYYDDQLARTIQRMAAMVEPVMLIVVGGIVGYVYIAFFVTLFAAAAG